jgi:hypothetical protein
MNIETLKQHIEAFTREVVNSGFKRDIADYIASLPSSQNNILALREIAGKLSSSLERIYAGDLPNALSALLPNPEVRPFTEFAHNHALRELTENSEVPQHEFFSLLNAKLTKLQQQIAHNTSEVAKIDQFVAPYVRVDLSEISEAELAIIAIILNHRETITSLRHFAKTLSAWNRTLPIYHQLLKSKSPEDIEIVEVQNGSIELIINLDVDVAINFAELFKVGFQVFAAYLTYKKMIQPIIESYHGNKKLIAGEEEREQLMLDNIGQAVKATILDQHKAAKKTDNKVDGTAIPKKVEEVAKLVTAHIVQGNDVKLLALPEQAEQGEGSNANAPHLGEELRKESTAARRALRDIPLEAHKKLLETYGKPENDETKSQVTA